MKRRRTPIPARLPAPAGQPMAEREYFRMLIKYAKAYQDLLQDGLKGIVPRLREESADELPPEKPDPAARMDANNEKEIRALFESVQSRLQKLFPDSVLRAWGKGMVGSVNRISKEQMVRVGKSVGVNLEPLMHDRELTPYFQNVVDENVGLIRSIAQADLPELKNRLVMAITQDMPAKDIQQMLQKHFGISKERARLIAVDQVGKLNGRLDQYRQQQIGGKRYRWRTSKDERVTGNPAGKYPHAKPSHWKREGKVYYWSNPPAGGHPKQRTRCRCWAEMVLEDVVE